MLIRNQSIKELEEILAFEVKRKLKFNLFSIQILNLSLKNLIIFSII